MRFTITSQGTDIPLQLDISGYILTVSDISDHSISVSDYDGRLAVCCIELLTMPCLISFPKMTKIKATRIVVYLLTYWFVTLINFSDATFGMLLSYGILPIIPKLDASVTIFVYSNV